MHSPICLAAALVLSSLPACGIPTEEYDARTTELRKASERARICDDANRQEQQRSADSQAGLEEMRAVVKDLQSERRELGISGPADIQALRGAVAEAAKVKQTAADRKTERERLALGLKPELEGGVVWIDDRGGIPRMVIPEEALFGSNSSQLGPPGKKVLDSVVAQLRAMPSRGILVAGYLDRTARSNPDKDMSLSLDRAWRVADYLAKHGIEKSLVGAAGFGQLEPIADNSSESARQRNRRVEIQLLAPVALPPPASSMPLASPSPRPAARQPSSAPASSAARAAPAFGAGIAEDPGL